MGKSPAFQWYPKDFESDTNVKLMTLKEVGAYVFLMNAEWIEQGLPVDDESLSILSKLGKEWFNGSGDKIRKCFKLKGDKLVHPRLEKERKKQKEWRDKSSVGGKKSAKARKIKADSVKGGSTTVATKEQPKGNIASASSSSSSIALKEVKHIYGKYKKVKLTDKQLETLKNEFPDDWESWIIRVDNYIETNGKKIYANSLQAIRNWASKEKKKLSKGSVNKKDYGDSGEDGTKF